MITYVVMLWWDYRVQSRRTTQYIEELVLGRANLTAGILDARLNLAEQLSQSLAVTLSGRDRIDAITRGRLGAALRQSEHTTGIVIAIEQGQAAAPRVTIAGRGATGGLALSDAPASIDVSEAPWYRQVRESGEAAWFTGGEIAGLFGVPTLAYSIPILGDDQTFRGVVSVHVSNTVFRLVGPARVQQVQQPIARVDAREPATNPSAASLFDVTKDHYFIVKASGQTIYHAPERATLPSSIFDPRMGPIGLELTPALVSARENRSQIVRAKAGREEVFTFNPGEEYFIAVVPVHEGDYLLMSTYRTHELLAPMHYNLIQRAVLLVSGLLMLVAIVIFSARQISRPIEELAEVTEAVGRGDLTVRAPEYRRSDEIASFSKLFNQMLQQLRDQVQQIRSESKARAMVENELSLARQIQTDLLPRRIPQGQGEARFGLHAMNVPANHVAGDFYDFFIDGSGRLTLAIADVAGHGVAAAMLMAITRTLIRQFSFAGLPLPEIVHRTNVTLLEDSSTSGMFVTLVLARYDPPSGTLTLVNAGHPPPVILRPGNAPRSLGESTAPLLGASEFDADEFRETSLHLETGDTLVLYTDGITEARNPDSGRLLGEAGLLETLHGVAAADLDAIQKSVVTAVERHERGPLRDDVTLLLLRRM